jgi:hypothetical protein
VVLTQSRILRWTRTVPFPLLSGGTGTVLCRHLHTRVFFLAVGRGNFA